MSGPQVRLRPMAAAEFPAYRRELQDGYAADMVANGGVEPAAAASKAEADVAALLADGVESEGAHLWVVEADGGRVGVVWLGVREIDGAPRAWLFDIEIDAQHRRRGLGRAAMLALEDEVRRLGHDAVLLNVFGGNTPARSLYRSVGYEESAVTMTKRLV